MTVQCKACRLRDTMLLERRLNSSLILIADKRTQIRKNKIFLLCLHRDYLPHHTYRKRRLAIVLGVIDRHSSARLCTGWRVCYMAASAMGALVGRIGDFLDAAAIALNAPA